MATKDDKSLPDQAVEALLYAPIGIAYEVLDRLPMWVARGKSQATITRALGKMAVQRGQSEFEDVVGDIFGVRAGGDAQGPQNAATAAKAGQTGAKTATVKASAPDAGDAKATGATAGKKPAAKKSSASKAQAKKPKTKTTSKSASTKATSTAKGAKPTKKAKPTKNTKKAKPAKSAKPVTEGDLALASYGSMPASQIVKRLDSLSAKQLEAVRQFEEANRHRVTVLNRIRQIQRSA